MAARTNTRRMHKLRQEFREECAAQNLPCWHDGMPIDYEASSDDFKNPNRFQLDHYWPVSTHPEHQEDPANFRPAHAECNERRGNAAPTALLGQLSREWV